MITFKNNCNDLPYLMFQNKYELARSAKQDFIEAISVSSYSSELNEVDSRFVNLKFINNKEFIFFTNFNSPKSIQFKAHDQIAVVIFWSKINLQIRMKANIKKIKSKDSYDYFRTRSSEKNALSISSNQSKKINSYKDVQDNYNITLITEDLSLCPSYWGGYSFTPYYFEFWEGHESRINKREAFELLNGNWKNFILQP